MKTVFHAIKKSRKLILLSFYFEKHKRYLYKYSFKFMKCFDNYINIAAIIILFFRYKHIIKN